MKETLEKIKTALGSMATSRNVWIAVAVIALLACGYLIYKSWNAPSTQAMAIITAKNENLKSNIARLNEKDAALRKEIKAKEKKSQKIIADLKKANAKLKVKYANIQPPKTRKEIAARLSALGYDLDKLCGPGAVGW